MLLTRLQEPSNKMVEMPEWLGKVKLWGGWQQPQMLQESMQSVEDLESQEGDTAAPTVPQEDTEPPMTDEPPSPPLPTRVSPPPPPPHNAAHGATVAVMSRPNVMSLKTVSTTLPWGEECRVMSELYAVLVTGVPKIQQQRCAPSSPCPCRIMPQQALLRSCLITLTSPDGSAVSTADLL